MSNLQLSFLFIIEILLLALFFIIWQHRKMLKIFKKKKKQTNKQKKHKKNPLWQNVLFGPISDYPGKWLLGEDKQFKSIRALCATFRLICLPGIVCLKKRNLLFIVYLGFFMEVNVSKKNFDCNLLFLVWVFFHSSFFLPGSLPFPSDSAYFEIRHSEVFNIKYYGNSDVWKIKYFKSKCYYLNSKISSEFVLYSSSLLLYRLNSSAYMGKWHQVQNKVKTYLKTISKTLMIL